jgi:hypothetical protein
MFISCIILSVLFSGIPHLFSSIDPAIQDFNERIQGYSDLRKKVERAVPPIDKKGESDPAAILAHEQALAAGIQASRAKAAEGDIFTPAVQKNLIAAIERELSSGRGALMRKMILGEGNPTNPESATPVDLQVNAKYPSKAPLSTVPPSLLLKLPSLPEGIEYRFVGRHLILYDSKANLIVDILRNAIR